MYWLHLCLLSSRQTLVSCVSCMRFSVSKLSLLISLAIFVLVSSLEVDHMDPSNLNLDGLTLSEEGLTLNLDSEPETAAILEHCLIGRVFADREI